MHDAASAACGARGTGGTARARRPALGADIRDVLTRLSPEHGAVLVLRDLERVPGRAALVPLGVRAEGRRKLARLAARTAARQ